MNPDVWPIYEPTSKAPRHAAMSNLVKQIAAWGIRSLGRILVVFNLVALIGHFVRGRAIWLELLLYLPLVLLGSATILAGSMLCGLGKRKEGSAIMLLGFVSILISLWWMIGRGPEPSLMDAAPGRVVRVLHWNVLWGGLAPVEESWRSMIDEIASKAPDIVVLSEAAPSPLRRSLIGRLGTGWAEIEVESPPQMRIYKYGLVVLSRWPMRFAGSPKIRNGTTSEVIVDNPARPIRILAIDGKSRPTIPRSMMLDDIAAICERAAESVSGRIDVVAGDFNCVGRTRGFDRIRLAAGGYSMASEASTGWRATWPSWFPLYDIDHVWVHRAIAIRSCALFSRFATDHRGQVVELVLP